MDRFEHRDAGPEDALSEGRPSGPPPLPAEAIPAAPRPGPILTGPGPERRAVRPAAPAPGARLRMFVTVSCLTVLGLLAIFGVGFLGDGPVRESPWPSADAFVSWLALGPELSPDSDDDRFGYARAHDMFTERLAAELPWSDFHQRWVLRTREYGQVMATERVTRQRRRGDRGRRRFVYRIRLGAEREHHEEMATFRLEFRLRRMEGGHYLVDSYSLVPSEGI